MALKLLGTLIAALFLSQTPAPGEKVAQQARSLIGTWQLVSFMTNGIKTEFPQEGRTEVAISANELSTKDLRFTYNTDDSANPKVLDLTGISENIKGKVFEGVYQIEGETLTICLFTGDGIKMRPNDFSVPAGSNNALFTMKRQTP